VAVVAAFNIPVVEPRAVLVVASPNFNVVALFAFCVVLCCSCGRGYVPWPPLAIAVVVVDGREFIARQG